MLFLKKKKLLEIDSKLDTVLDKLIESNKKYEEIICILSQIENRISGLEEQIENNLEHKETINGMYEQLTELINNDVSVNQEYVKSIRNEINDNWNMVDSSLRLLLLNNVMSQIKE